MNINKINSTNFNGYKNVLSTTLKDNEINSTFSCIGLQLDNNGQNDLEKWHHIQKNLLKRKELSDIMVFKVMCLGDKSKFFIDEFELEPTTYKRCSNEETQILKAFSLIGSLTNRIKNEYFPPEDSKRSNVLVEITKDLAKTFKDMKSALTLSHFIACKRVKHQVTADLFHTKIHQKMNKYFML